MHLQGFGEFSNSLNANLSPFLRSRKRSVHVMTKNSFSVRLFRARVDKGISQSELASAAEVAPAQVSRYEAGRNIPRPHVAAKLAAALDVDVDWLMAGAEPTEDDGSRPAQRFDDGEFVFQPSPENLEKLKALSTLTGKSPDELVQQMFEELEARLQNSFKSTIHATMAPPTAHLKGGPAAEPKDVEQALQEIEQIEQDVRNFKKDITARIELVAPAARMSLEASSPPPDPDKPAEK